MNLIEGILHFLLTFIALSLAGIIFLIKNEITIPFDRLFSVYEVPNWISYFIYFFLYVVSALGTLQYTRLLGSDQFSKGSIIESELSNDTYLPVFLGCFFVALSIEKFDVFAYVFGFISVFIFFSRAAYFNPFYFLFGFRFYSMKTNENVKIMVLTKRSCKIPREISFKNIKRFNNYTFIDTEK